MKDWERWKLELTKKLIVLITTLDKFLKRLTNIEDEFEIMKADINRMKKNHQREIGCGVIIKNYLYCNIKIATDARYFYFCSEGRTILEPI